MAAEIYTRGSHVADAYDALRGRTWLMKAREAVADAIMDDTGSTHVLLTTESQDTVNFGPGFRTTKHGLAEALPAIVTFARRRLAATEGTGPHLCVSVDNWHRFAERQPENPLLYVDVVWSD